MLTALPPDQVQCFHEHLNSIESTIQFTTEVELSGTLPFLDARITHHSDGSLSNMVFRKSTHMDKYLHFKSHHPWPTRRQWPRLCSTVPKISAQISQTRRRKSCQKLEAITTCAGHTHSHSNPPLHPPLVGNYLEDLGPT